MTAVSRTSRVIGPTATRPAAASARPRNSARLPVSGWQLRWRRQPEGRTVLEVTDQASELTGLAASTACRSCPSVAPGAGPATAPTAPGSGGR